MTEKQHNQRAVFFYGLTILDLVGILLFPPAKLFFLLGAAGFYVTALCHRFQAAASASNALKAELRREAKVKELRP